MSIDSVLPSLLNERRGHEFVVTRRTVHDNLKWRM